MLRCPSEVDFCGRRPAESLVRAEVRIVNEAHLDLPPEVLSDQRSQQPQPESFLQGSPEPLDKGVGVQWELRPIPALRNPRFAIALPLGARRSDHVGPVRLTS